jgi:hypothetical protein
MGLPCALEQKVAEKNDVKMTKRSQYVVENKG